MKNTKKPVITFTLSVFAGASLLFGGTYIVPKEYDNLYISNKSKGAYIINNSTSVYSAERSFSGHTLRFRCVSVPKIDCRAASASINLSISDISLKDPSTNKQVPVYAREAIAEDKGNYWNVCAAAYGGVGWDNTDLTYDSAKDKINYTYEHDKLGSFFYFFTDGNSRGLNIGHANSYIVVTAKQTCR